MSIPHAPVMRAARHRAVHSDRVLLRLAVVGTLAVAATLAPLARAAAQASAHAHAGGGQVSIGCSGLGEVGEPSGSPTSVASIASSRGGGPCRSTAAAFSYLGVVGTRAAAELVNVTDPLGGGIGAEASSAWGDAIQPFQRGFTLVRDLRGLRLRYSVGASGSTFSNDDRQGGASGSAAIAYAVAVGGSRLSGRSSTYAGQRDEPPFTFGSLIGTVDLGVSEVAPGQYSLASFAFSMSASASATAGQEYNPGRGWLTPGGNVRGTAEFGSTLDWQGIRSIRGIGAAGEEIALPDDFQLELRGAQTGFDYWNAAPRLASPVTTVPEPGSWALLAGGLVGVAAVARRRPLPGGRRTS